MILREIKTFGILGAGTLGWKIGLQAAISGFEVLMFDISSEQLTRSTNFQAQLCKRLVRVGTLTEAESIAALERIATTTVQAAFASSIDFVSESVTEDLELKRKVWEGFRGKWKENVVLTTNTSYLLPSQMVDIVGDPERFCAFHFHDVFDARVVDVMGHPGTSKEVIEFLLNLGRKLNQIPVHVKHETSGYLFNAMLMAYLGAAGSLLARGKASVEAIDRSWMGNMSTAIGPFGMMDVVGLDTVDHILRVRTDRQSIAFREVITPYISAGKLGVKTREGFYSYPRPSYADPEFLL